MMRTRWATLVSIAAVLGLLAGACAGDERASERPPAAAESPAGPAQGPEGERTEPAAGAIAIEVHKSPTCDCCGDYEDYLAGHGFAVTSVPSDDVPDLKRDLGIPDEMASCHTALVEGYFVEGHVPVEVIQELLEQRPDVDGISLPGMPPGSPGMGGVKSEPWTIWAIDEGSAEVFAEI